VLSETKTILVAPLLRPKKVLAEVMNMEAEARRFYTEAVNQVTAPTTQKMFRDLAEEKEDHQDLLVKKWKENKNRATSQ
jgi:rubrerythrin